MSSIAGPREAGARCPYCDFELALDDPFVACADCGAVHHRSCWDVHPACGSYSCKPGQREVHNEPAERLVITAEDIAGAIPIRGRPTGAFAPSLSSPPTPSPRVSRMAIASLITAVVGIPIFGLITGLVAIGLASLALSRMQASHQKGLGLAIGGLLLGIADVVGWVAVIAYALTGHVEVFMPEGSEPKVSPADVAPKIYRAMQANVLIDRRSGWGGMATGSGVILDISDGAALIVTNRHVVDGSFSSGPAPADLDSLNKGHLTVKLLNGPTRPGRVTWAAPDGIDLALVRIAISPDEAQAAQWERSRPLRVGDTVFAIGNPQRLNWTHTQGVVSQFRSMNQNGRTVRVIQTQTAINPGNSGGGLYDDDAYLVGINTWTSDKRSSEGLSFAIMFESLLALNPPGIVAHEAKGLKKGAHSP
jgi:S1-C subfamily serine protease